MAALQSTTLHSRRPICPPCRGAPPSRPGCKPTKDRAESWAVMSSPTRALGAYLQARARTWGRAGRVAQSRTPLEVMAETAVQLTIV